MKQRMARGRTELQALQAWTAWGEPNPGRRRGSIVIEPPLALGYMMEAPWASTQGAGKGLRPMGRGQWVSAKGIAANHHHLNAVTSHSWTALGLSWKHVSVGLVPAGRQLIGYRNQRFEFKLPQFIPVSPEAKRE